MQVVSVVLVAIACLSLSASTGSRNAQVPGVDYIQINGSKTPNSVPRWLAWQKGLGVLARSASDEDSVVFALVADNGDDRKRIGEFAVAQDEHWAQCRSRQLAVLERLRGVEPSHVQGRLLQEQISCRTALLAAKDHFLATISPNAARRLRTFIDDHRKGIEVLVPRAEIDNFYRPR